MPSQSAATKKKKKSVAKRRGPTPPALRLDAHAARFRALEQRDPGAGARLIRSVLEPELLRPAQRRRLEELRASPAAAKRAGISAAGLRVYGHCKAAANAYWLLMAGVSRDGAAPLELVREAMRDGQLHFWVREARPGGRVIDPTRAQLTRALYPHHDYAAGVRARVGSNQGGRVVTLDGRRYRVAEPTWRVLRAVIDALPPAAAPARARPSGKRAAVKHSVKRALGRS